MKAVTAENHRVSVSGESVHFSYGLLSRKDYFDFDSIHHIQLYPNMLVIDHDDGTLHIRGPFDDRHRPLLEALRSLADCYFEDMDVQFREENGLASVIFYVVATLAIAGAIFELSVSDPDTQPITFLLYLLPGFCIAFLAKRFLFRAAGAVVEKFAGMKKDGGKK